MAFPARDGDVDEVGGGKHNTMKKEIHAHTLMKMIYTLNVDESFKEHIDVDYDHIKLLNLSVKGKWVIGEQLFKDEPRAIFYHGISHPESNEIAVDEGVISKKIYLLNCIFDTIEIQNDSNKIEIEIKENCSIENLNIIDSKIDQINIYDSIIDKKNVTNTECGIFQIRNSKVKFLELNSSQLKPIILNEGTEINYFWVKGDCQGDIIIQNSTIRHTLSFYLEDLKNEKRDFNLNLIQSNLGDIVVNRTNLVRISINKCNVNTIETLNQLDASIFKCRELEICNKTNIQSLNIENYHFDSVYLNEVNIGKISMKESWINDYRLNNTALNASTHENSHFEYIQLTSHEILNFNLNDCEVQKLNFENILNNASLIRLHNSAFQEIIFDTMINKGVISLSHLKLNTNTKNKLSFINSQMGAVQFIDNDISSFEITFKDSFIENFQFISKGNLIQNVKIQIPVNEVSRLHQEIYFFSQMALLCFKFNDRITGLQYHLKTHLKLRELYLKKRKFDSFLINICHYWLSRYYTQEWRPLIFFIISSPLLYGIQSTNGECSINDFLVFNFDFAIDISKAHKPIWPNLANKLLLIIYIEQFTSTLRKKYGIYTGAK